MASGADPNPLAAPARRRCTTHWRWADERPVVTPGSSPIRECSTWIVTGAGNAANIDVFLHLLRREYGAATANVIDGGQAQYVPVPVPALREQFVCAAAACRPGSSGERLRPLATASDGCFAVKPCAAGVPAPPPPSPDAARRVLAPPGQRTASPARRRPVGRSTPLARPRTSGTWVRRRRALPVRRCTTSTGRARQHPSLDGRTR